ncbi:signal peptidase I [Arthrobacter sp. H14]|uniref:signal peptidase I n=1 Tax=Arthrobacter sp. H14 TaxID=1312959 RepID=UPI0004B99B1C|nr:signal peptidase I [Arthrobacter sp. H14]
MHDTQTLRGNTAENNAKRRPRKLGWRFVLWAAIAGVVAAAIVRAFFVEIYYIPSGSMEPTLQEGDRVLVSRTGFDDGGIRHGDLVVFDGRGSFAPLHSGDPFPLTAAKAVGQWLGLTGSDTVYVKRAIGLPGDRVACCDKAGRLLVNGDPLEENYLYPQDAASELEFDVRVPEGKLWLMGDHRSVSADSRSLLGAPGGGFVPIERIIGRPTTIIWPLDRIGPLERVPAAGGTALTMKGA